MLNNYFLSEDQIRSLGIKCGKNCKIHASTLISHPKKLILKSNVRIDALTIIINPNFVRIDNTVHISQQNLIYANNGEIKFKNYSGTSAGVKIYTSADDYSGRSFYGPFNNKISKKKNVTISKFCIIGANSVILPNAKFEEGATIGALSLVNEKLKKWTIYSGNPLKLVMKRSQNVKKYVPK